MKGGLPTLFLFALGVCVVLIAGEYEETEYPPYDGWFNNRAQPSWGGAETQMVRRLSTAYSDGVYEPSGTRRPNPIEISERIMSGPTGMRSERNRTAFLVFFGQQVVEEVLDAQRPGCPPEYMNIKIPTNHTDYNPEGREDRYMPFLRSRYDQRTGLSPNNPRQQLNEISAYIDGTLMYGPNKAWTDALRSFTGGRLAATNDTDPSEGYFPAYNDVPRLPFANPPPPRNHYLKPVNRFFKIGNPRGNENPFLLTFGIVWFRYHNLRARQLEEAHPDWSDEKLFNEARKWVIGIYQKLVIYDWIPQWLGETLDPYVKYDTTVNPGITHAFQSAAMRFGHTLVPPGVWRRNKACQFRETSEVTGFEGHRAVRTCNSYWNPQEAISEGDIDELLLGMSSQITEREDNIITPDLRGSVFGPLEFSRRDLMAVNIQRARDHGLPDYNTAREEYNLPRITNFQDINPTLNAQNPQLFVDLEDVYHGNLNEIDIWVGGLLETTGAGPGPLFRSIIKDQFTRIRDGDRFWYENRLNGLFTDAELAEINRTTIKDIVMAVTDIDDGDMQDNPFLWGPAGNFGPCAAPFQLNGSIAAHLAPCTALQGFDYFSGSEASYIISLLALGVVLILTIVLLFVLAKKRQSDDEARRRARRRTMSGHKKNKNEVMQAAEWQGKSAGERNVIIRFDDVRRHIILTDEKMKPLRYLDLTMPIKLNAEVEIRLGADRYNRTIALHVRNEYDTVLNFDDMKARSTFYERLKTFFDKAGVRYNPAPYVMSTSAVYKTAYTKMHRQELLEKFFRVVFAHAFDEANVNQKGRSRASQAIEKLNIHEHREILKCELTRAEFAEALSLKPTSLFVENMYKVVDKNNDGYVSFREFLDMILIFANGSAETKAQVLFNMYDIEGQSRLTREDFSTMLRSMIELASEELSEDQINKAIDTIFHQGGFANKEYVSFQDFQTMLKGDSDILKYASITFEGAGIKSSTHINNRTIRARQTIHGAYTSDGDARRSKLDQERRAAGGGGSGAGGSGRANGGSGDSDIQVRQTAGTRFATLTAITTYLDNNRRQIFWVSLYTFVSIGIFAERAYYYSVEREHAGLRRIAGYGVTVTRGAASGMMFTFSCLLVTMCRNTITFLRETFLNRYIPFDDYIHMHKFIAWFALFFTAMHIIGHGINFYHVATQTADDLTCLFRNFYHATDELPKLHYWLWNTLTGFTGVLLTIVMILMYVFATSYSRQHTFKVFWITHHLYIPFFILMVLHGAGRLVQPPFFHYFFLGPVVLYTLDRLVSASRKKIELSVMRAETLPSEVTYLEFQRPQNFEYKSGQWVKIASLVQSSQEYHPFTLTSAPHEENLTLHIRAVGPWTTNLRNIYDRGNIKEHAYPKIYLDGPYGEGHQDWYKYEVAVLVGGGIGVTPFASILKDIAYRSQQGVKINCKKVYFLWVTRTQRQFEWMTDIIRTVEENDQNDLVSIHIFVTQFREKFDIRTTMLYICERHFQKIAGRSLFTGLRSITHFGRPDFQSFFTQLLEKHSDTSVFGVFSCGPPPMTSGVEDACSLVNRRYQEAILVHHYENF